MKIVNKFETLRVIHNIWKKGQMHRPQVDHLLKTVHFIKLKNIDVNKIEAESLDGKIKYLIK